MIFEAGSAGKLAHFELRLERLDEAADFVADTIRLNYPSLKVPFHSRWRHFVIEGQDRWLKAAGDGSLPPGSAARARARFELAITSVLLDAGAGPAWRWAEPVSSAAGVATWRHVGRSEGLALASFAAWERGYFSSTLDEPRRVDAEGLRTLSVDELSKAFLVGPDNPLDGLEGRAALLNRLGDAITARPDLFGTEGRLGGLFDTLVARAEVNVSPPPSGEGVGVGGESVTSVGLVHPTPAPSPSRGGGKVVVAAPDILRLLLEALGSIWPGRIALDGVDLGDTWRHPAVVVPGPTKGLVPFHKLSQWLSYSLIEPLQEAGIEVTDIDGLTGLAEYRNGGLFVDLGVIEPRSASLQEREHHPGDEPIVEWRALTVVLLDRIAPLVRAKLGVTADAMPLASVLEGGTWSAGRRIAKQKRADGGPPVRIISDGSVF